MAIDVFLSVGRTATPQQEEFVRSVEDCLIGRGLFPRTVGRTEFSSIQPLKRVEELMNECNGTVVVAFERTFIGDGWELRGGPGEEVVKNATLPTPWNQIEAAMAYVLRQPILVITERGLRGGGLIERGYDWYVLPVDMSPEACRSREFLGVIDDWKKRVEAFQAARLSAIDIPAASVDVGTLTVSQILSSLKPSQLWAILVAATTLLGISYAIGVFVSGIR
jgi:hypothetical protein